MRKTFATRVAAVAMAALLALPASLSARTVDAHADTSTGMMDGEVKIEYVDSIDNMQYPSTDKYYALYGYHDHMTFTLTEPTMVKTFIKWNDSNVQSVKVSYTRDEKGLDVIGETKEFRDSGNFIIHALDAGTYYVHYEFKKNSGTDDQFWIASAGLCILGQKLESTEDNPISSFNKPNILADGSTMKGALTVTSPIDYYKITVPKEGTVKLTFNFETFRDFGSSYGGTVVLYDSDKTKLVSKNFSSYSSDDNYIEKELKSGYYYVEMSGMETGTSLTYKFTEKKAEQTEKDSTGTVKVEYVGSVDNAQYPATSKFKTSKTAKGSYKFTIKKKTPTIVKAYVMWDKSVYTGTYAWLSRDAAGMDIIGKKEYLSESAPYLYHLLDPGTYYVNFEHMGGYDATGAEATGVAILGQKVKSSEKVYASSFSEPTTMKNKKKYKGFLSLTAPADYYKLKLTSASNVTFTFDFATLNGNAPYGGKFELYSGSQEFLYSKSFSTSGASDNKFEMHLKKGTYYIVLSGAETYTTVKYTAKSTDVKFKEKANDNGTVTLTYSCPVYFKEVFYRAGKYSKDSKEDYSVWSSWADGCTLLSGTKSVTVKKNGYYTFRMTDNLGNVYINTYKVTKCK